MCRFDDADGPSYYKEVIRRSRKNHRCAECRRVIEKGELYTYFFGVWDCKPAQYKACSYCVEWQQWLVKECGGFLFTELYSEIMEHAEEYRSFKHYRAAINIASGWRRELKKEQNAKGRCNAIEKSTYSEKNT